MLVSHPDHLKHPVAISLLEKLTLFRILIITKETDKLSELLDQDIFFQFLIGGRVQIPNESFWIQCELKDILDNFLFFFHYKSIIGCEFFLKYNPIIANWFYCNVREDLSLPSMPEGENILNFFLTLLSTHPELAQQMWFMNPKIPSLLLQYLKPESLEKLVIHLQLSSQIDPLVVQSIFQTLTQELDIFFALEQLLHKFLQENKLEAASFLYKSCDVLQQWLSSREIYIQNHKLMISLEVVNNFFYQAYTSKTLNLCYDILKNNPVYCTYFFGTKSYLNRKDAEEEVLIQNFICLLNPQLIEFAYQMLHVNDVFVDILKAKLDLPGNELTFRIATMGRDFAKFVDNKIINRKLTDPSKPFSLNIQHNMKSSTVLEQLEREREEFESGADFDPSKNSVPISIEFEGKMQIFLTLFRWGYQPSVIEKIIETHSLERLTKLIEAHELVNQHILSPADFITNASSKAGADLLTIMFTVYKEGFSCIQMNTILSLPYGELRLIEVSIYLDLFKAFQWSPEEITNIVVDYQAFNFTKWLFTLIKEAETIYPHRMELVSLIQQGNIEQFQTILNDIPDLKLFNLETLKDFWVFVATRFQVQSVMTEPSEFSPILISESIESNPILISESLVKPASPSARFFKPSEANTVSCEENAFKYN